MVLKRALLGAALALSLSACNSQPSALVTLDLGTQAQIGLEFVTQRGCADCHQSSHDSDGILSGQTTPAPGSRSAYPANLTSDITTGIGGWADIEIVRAMRYGFDNNGQPLCAPMPHFASMTDVEANAIVAYLRSLPPVARAIPPSVCPPLKPAAIDMAMGHD